MVTNPLHIVVAGLFLFELVLILVLTVDVVITIFFCSANNFSCLCMDLHASLPFDVSLNPCVNFFSTTSAAHHHLLLQLPICCCEIYESVSDI